ncbi:hypothetical protein BH09CHL1_BH09CHL1_21160 [soil metagenome]
MNKANLTMSSIADRRAILAGAGLTAMGLAGLTGTNRAGATEATPAAYQVQRSEKLAPDFADLPYVTDGDSAQVLDVYTPLAGAPTPYPLVLWIHGGGWTSGDKRNIAVRYLLDDGFAIASMNYRLMPEALFPAQIQDANAALSWVWDNAKTFKFDLDRVIVAGGSAGGTSTVLTSVSLNNDVPEFRSDSRVKIAAMIDFFGISSEEHAGVKASRNSEVAALIADPDNAATLQLLNTAQFIDSSDPPALILHGEEDATVSITQSEELAGNLEAAGVPVTFKRFPNAGHGGDVSRAPETPAIVRGFLDDVFAIS